MQDSVVSFEKNHGIQLPSDYRLFIYKYNGGETIKTNWPGKEMLIANGKGHKIDEKKVALWQKEIDRYVNIHQEIIEL